MMEVAMAAPAVRLSAVDLNLLVVFEALMQERNVTRAANNLAMSQPALSHALKRLRHMLRDELFIRSPKGMIPTPRAEQLALPVRRALDELRHSLEPSLFEPSTASRHFQIAVDNYAAIVLAPSVAARITKTAPGVTLEFRPSGTLNIPDLLDRGQLDLALGPPAHEGERFSQRPLLEDIFVALLRRNHPVTAAPKLTIETFAALPHLEISSSAYDRNFVDEALSRKKLTRRIAMRAPFLSVVRILAKSDAVAVLSVRVARELMGYRPLVMQELPFPSPTLETAMTWPRWLENQPAHRWLRDNVQAAAKALSNQVMQRG
jgi:DNA-binding transcriptional LysR family regulator